MNFRKLAAVVCAAIGLILSTFEGVAGGAVLAVSIFLFEDGTKIGTEAIVLVLCIALPMLCLSVWAGSFIISSVLVAVSTASAIFIVLKALSEIGSEGGQ